MLSDASATITAVPLDRPPRPHAGAITDRVRRAILAAASRIDFEATELLDRHAHAESLAEMRDIVDDVEERYGLEPTSLLSDPQTQLRLGRIEAEQGILSATELLAQCVLYALPDTEFLTVIEHAVADGEPSFISGRDDLANAAEAILEAHGCAFRREPGNWPHVAWVGDPKQHELTVQPALQALADPRLAGAQDEFDDALLRRRRGAPKELAAAIGKAASAVESTLKILHHEHNIPLPKSGELGSLFGRLSSNGSGRKALLPGWLEHLVLAAGGPRNNMSSHGQGATIRVVPEELADASIAAAATAITLLAHYLP